MNRVYETAAETAKKIRSMLKQAFPGVKFSVTSSTYSMGSSVNVSWTDGPLAEDVDNVLVRFKSGSFDGMQDMYTTTGYEWEGQIVVGAKYISSSRELTAERRTVIETKLQTDYVPDMYGCFGKFAWAKAERQLIDSRELQGYPSQLPMPVHEESPEVEPQSGKVIAFPVQAVRDPKLAGKLKADRFMQSLNPEQRFKMAILQTMLGTEKVDGWLTSGTVSIDELFTIAANHIFG